MKIAVTSTGPDLEAEVDPRFGRCQYFIILDPETLVFEAVENTSALSGGGAGIASGQAIAGKGVKAVLTGNCGPNAFQVLSSAGVQVISGVSGKVRDAVEMYRSGKYQETSRPTVGAHSGMGMGLDDAGVGKAGIERSEQNRLKVEDKSISSTDEEIKFLKSKAAELMDTLKEIQLRIEKLENVKGKGEM
ncbi:MAG: NifB/NifX family molybdenum-iron cluster-binding protein [Spirochaetota bacterium]